MKKGTILWNNHDCFYTHDNSLEIVKKLYFESYLKLIINNNTLTTFFNSNETKDIATVNKFLSKININLNEVISDVEAGQAIICKHIFSQVFRFIEINTHETGGINYNSFTVFQVQLEFLPHRAMNFLITISDGRFDAQQQSFIIF